ncbi:hypothetical protein [Primorskyibacter sp. S87]|uniref:hypothetical protein n=1 Tax=Primorskyibacter sp. S87 TaxID=3415126 RepID=UPI003C7E13EB
MPAFDDILDGYFPLRTSITDLMQRRNLRHAVVKLSFAPIIEVDGLHHDAPVPLNIRGCRAGMIRAAELNVAVAKHGIEVSGHAHWFWLNRMPTADHLNPMIRLAEPALARVIPQRTTPSFGRGVVLTRNLVD